MSTTNHSKVSGLDQLDAPADLGAVEYMEPIGRQLKRRSSLPALLLADTLALSLAILMGGGIANIIDGRTYAANVDYLPFVVLFLPVMAGYGLYRRARRRLVASMFPDLSQLFHSLVVSCLLSLLVTHPVHDLTGLAPLDRKAAVLVGAWALVLVPIARAVTRWLLRGTRRTSRVLVVGSGQVASTVLQRLGRVSGMQLVGCVDDGFPMSGDVPTQGRLLGALDDLPRVVRENDIDHIVVAFSPATGAKLAGLLRSLADEVQISVVPRLFDLLTVRSHVDDLHGLPVVDVAPAALGPADRFAKRALDIVLSSLLLLAASPVFIVVATAIKVTSTGPVLFRQQRTGRAGAAFRICKFRTMRAGAEADRGALAGVNQVDGPLFKMHDDPRITKVGGFLRATSLDEVPQLLNVLVGNMSLVGPRPFVTAESAEIDGWAARRFAVRPGMTGLWQISGRNDLPFDELRRLDYSYVASWSLWWDLRILWHTPASVLSRQGAY